MNVEYMCVVVVVVGWYSANGDNDDGDSDGGSNVGGGSDGW